MKCTHSQTFCLVYTTLTIIVYILNDLFFFYYSVIIDLIINKIRIYLKIKLVEKYTSTLNITIYISLCYPIIQILFITSILN